MSACVDYVAGLQENLKAQDAASEEVRAKFKKALRQGGYIRAFASELQ
jgi:hypothetical protein